MTTFDIFINQFDELNTDDQYELAETLRQRAIERRRAQMAVEAKQTRADFDAGKPFYGLDRLREL